MKIIYKLNSKENVRDIHWTPDGKYIYVASYFSTGDRKREKLININNGHAQYFEGGKLGFKAYSWK